MQKYRYLTTRNVLMLPFVLFLRFPIVGVLIVLAFLAERLHKSVEFVYELANNGLPALKPAPLGGLSREEQSALDAMNSIRGKLRRNPKE